MPTAAARAVGALLLAAAGAAAAGTLPPPSCNLTGTWCCETTVVVQEGSAVFTNASYGTGVGTIAGSLVNITFSNNATPILGTVDAACASISWSNGASWARSVWPGPAAPAPAWLRNLSIYELNPRAYTSPNGAGDGSGSGTWASLAARVPYLAALGATGLWVAGSYTANAHFYNIWSTYAMFDPTALDPSLGTAADFRAFLAAAHAAGLRVFLDAVTHGIDSNASVVGAHPDWFAGSSWGMTDFNYSNPGMFSWWNATWAAWVAGFGVDGFRLDIADTDWELHGFDGAVATGAALGQPIAVFGETQRYHFGQHDSEFSPAAFADLVAAFAPAPCFFTTQFSCHDSGWESGPGNYFTLRGSRAWFGYAGAFSYNIPLFLGGEEFDEDPVVPLPNLQKELYGGGGPGGWMYGSQRQWGQLTTNASKAAMLADVTRMFAIARAEADVLHRDRCDTAIVRVPVTAAAADGEGRRGAGAAADIVAVPYARFIAGVKAVLVFANADSGADADLLAAVPLGAMGLAGRGQYIVTDLWGNNGGGAVQYSEAALAALPVSVLRDRVEGGGLAVLRVEPA
jgi:hypothetical protein